MKSSNIPYLPQVDHLRALAAVWIVLYHGTQLIGSRLDGREFDWSQWEHTANPAAVLIREGHSAVSLFMVLSGFIFTYGAIGRRVRYGPFLLNRVLRIYPLYVLVGLWVLTARSAAGVQTPFPSLLTTFLPLADLKIGGTVEVVPMAWAVAVEFQFYLLFPFLVARFEDRPLRVAGGVLAVALVFRVLGVLHGANPRDLTYWHLLGRIDQFVFGMLAGVARHRLGRGAAAAGLTAGAPLVVGVLYAFHGLGGLPSEAGWKVVWPTVEGAAWGLFVFGYVGAGSARPRWLSNMVVAVGEASYSIYLLHWLLIQPLVARVAALPRPTGDPWADGLVASAGVLLPVTIGLSLLTYRVIERPFLAYRVRYLADPALPRGG